MRNGRAVVAVVSGLLAVVLTVLWLVQRSSSPTSPGNATTTGAAQSARSSSAPASAASGPASSRGTRTASTPPASTPPAGAATPDPALGCASHASPMVPTRMLVPSMGVDSPVLSLGLADDGTPATPPFEQPMSVGWYNRGPHPGAGQGSAVLTAHTFHAGGALGNRMQEQHGGLRTGAVLALRDDQGHTQCYRLTEAVKVWVKDYDPQSTVIYDEQGAPRISLVTCADWDGQTWDSRIVYHAVPLAG